MAEYSICCKSCNYRLDGLPAGECPECGSAFDPADPHTWQRVLSEPVKIARLSANQAPFAKTALDQAGIPATIQHEAGGVIGYYDIPQGSIWVNREDRERATEIVRAITSEDAEPPGEDWTCPNCSEIIEAQFAICWNCGAERE